MKILYDHQIYQHQRFGGVSRYFTEIIKHLPADVEADVSVLYSFNEYLKETSIPFQFEYQLLNWADRNFKGKQRLLAFLEKHYPEKYPNRLQLNKGHSIRKIQQGDFDIFHPTFFEDYYLDYIGDKPYVLTIHDMIIELYPEFINSPGFIKRKKKLADNAAHIIAVSENTKKDVVDVFNISPDKISVVHHASSIKETLSDIQLPSRYLLYVGDRRLGYKNFAFFVTAIQPILEQYKDLYLVCTGAEFTSDELSFFKALGLADRIQSRFVDETDLYTVYNKAEMFIYPSYYEGFGIPILESFQASCPVVLADASCFREVAGDAALYFNAKSQTELRERVLNIFTDNDLRRDLIEKGRRKLVQYSWTESSKQTIEIYQKVLRQ